MMFDTKFTFQLADSIDSALGFGESGSGYKGNCSRISSGVKKVAPYSLNRRAVCSNSTIE